MWHIGTTQVTATLLTKERCMGRCMGFPRVRYQPWTCSYEESQLKDESSPNPCPKHIPWIPAWADI